MKYLKFYALLALLLTAGGVTTQAQTEDDFWMEINPPTTGIHSLIVDSEGNIIVGASGVYCSRDEGMTWGLIGLEDCGILCLYEHTDGTLLAGSNYANSLYKREAGSTEWQALPIPTNASSVSFGVTADNSLLVGTWNGIYKSTDWDSTWTNVFEDPNGNSVVVNLVKLNNGTMLASIKDYNYMGLGGLFQSADNGDTWENLGFDNTDKRSLAKNSQDVIYLGSAAYPMGFHRSSDYGSTWQSFLSNKCVESLAVDNNDVVYANLFCWSWPWSVGIVRSGDNGETWDYINSGKNSEVEKLYLSDDGYLYGFGFNNDKIYRSRKSVYEEFEIDVVACPEEGGTAIGSGTYHFGERAHLSASANEHYRFACWTNQDGDTISTEAEYDHMIARGGQITANFQLWEELIITPDTLWFESTELLQHFTIDNQTFGLVTIQDIFLDPESFLEVQSPQNFAYILQPGESVQVEILCQGLPAKDNYAPFDIRMTTSMGERHVVAMINTAVADRGLTVVGESTLVFESPQDNPQVGVLINQNYGTHSPITISSITENDTHYLRILPEGQLPCDVEAGRYFRIIMYTQHITSKTYATTTVTVESSAGQKQFDVIINGDLLTVDEHSEEVELFPNPAREKIVIDGIEVAEVQVYNAMGQKVKTVQNTNEIDMGCLPEGVYLLRIKATDGYEHTGRVAVSK